MKNFLIITSCLLLSVSNYAQTRKIKGNGNVVSKDRNIQSFNKLIVDGDIELTLVNSPLQKKINITTDANLHQLIDSEIKEGTLTIKIKDNIEIIKQTETFKISLTNKDINEITLNGNATIETVGINEVNNLSITNNGNGEIRLSIKTDDFKAFNNGNGSISADGKSNLISIKNNGSGNVNFGNVSTFFTEVHNTGSGNVYTNSVNGLDGTLTGSGNIYYKTTKTVNIENTGTGKVIKE